MIRYNAFFVFLLVLSSCASWQNSRSGDQKMLNSKEVFHYAAGYVEQKTIFLDSGEYILNASHSKGDSIYHFEIRNITEPSRQWSCSVRADSFMTQQWSMAFDYKRQVVQFIFPEDGVYVEYPAIFSVKHLVYDFSECGIGGGRFALRIIGDTLVLLNDSSGQGKKNITLDKQIKFQIEEVTEDPIAGLTRKRCFRSPLATLIIGLPCSPSSSTSTAPK